MNRKDWIRIYVRIRTPKKLNTNIPGSIKAGGKKVVQGGPGIEVRDTKTLSKIKKSAVKTSRHPKSLSMKLSQLAG